MDTKMIGNKIAKARKEATMSQAQLAQRLFISPQAVGKWERGESIPDIITISRLAEILGVDFNYFSENYPPAASGSGINHSSNNELPAQESTDRNGPPARQLLTNFSGSNLTKSDFAGITAHNMKFNGSALRGTDFAGADLTGTSFSNSDMRDTNFDGANLTDCTLSVADLAGAHFSKTILVRTTFSKLGMTGVKFADADLTNVKISMSDLRTTSFDNCRFNNVDFENCDLRGVCLDGQSFTGVQFDKTALNEATFAGATLKNVSFISTFALTNKYYRAIKTIRFDGAMMDKLTYASLKGLGADLSKVTLIG